MQHPVLFFGGDYNPEQWPRSTWDEDIQLMKKAGVNLVTVAVFAWSKLEPEEGRYDLEWLEELFNLLHGAGIGIDLATGTASPPAWMAQSHPETLPIDKNGVQLGFGSRQQYCPSNAYFREKAVALAGQMARRFGSHPALKLWHVSNEYGCHVYECFCDSCRGHFRDFLERKYGNIDALNAAWGTDFWSQRYQNFQQVNAPSAMPTMGNPSQLLDWKRFCSDTLIECFDGEAKEIRRHSDVPITTNFMGLFPHIDYFKLAAHLDVVSDDSYPEPADPTATAAVALESDLARSYKRAPFLLMEQAPSAVQWRPVNSPKRPGQNQLWSLQRVAGGADGILHFQWRQSRAGAETFHSAMLPHSGENSRIFQETCQLGKQLQSLAPVVGEGVETPVALVWEIESDWAAQCAVGPSQYDFGQGIRAWHRTLFEMGFAIDIVTPSALLEGAANYRLMVVPQLFMEREGLAKRLRQLAEDGAQVVVAGPSFYVDQNLHAFTSESPTPLQELTGVRLIEPWPASPASAQQPLYAAPDPRVDRITAAVKAPSAQSQIDLEVAEGPLLKTLESLAKPRPALQGGQWAELIEITDPKGETLATYLGSGAASDLAGCPAVVKRPLGAGNCFYSAVDLDNLGRFALLKLAATYARLQPVIADLPAGVQAAVRGKYCFLLNHSDRAVQLPGISGHELLTDSRATGHIVLAPRSGAVVEIA